MDIATLTTPQNPASNVARSQFSANFDTFLTLLTTQLRNQDPLEPLDTEQFTQQLVQFSGVEQSIQTNQHLEALIALQSASSNETALSMVGKIATVRGDAVSFDNGQANWRYRLSENAASTTLNILDANGAVVASFNGDTDAGLHEFSWNGVKTDGSAAAPGAYRLDISAQDQNGVPINVEAFVVDIVTAAAFDDGAAYVELGGEARPVSDVIRVDLPRTNSNGAQ